MNETDNTESRIPIVLIDDDEELGRSLVRLLRHEGFAPDFFADGETALQAIAAGNYQVILSDIAMPHIDGIEMMRRVRQYDFDIPIILLTGEPTIDSAKKAIELGAYRYLTKPFDREELVSTVRSAVFVHRMAKIKREAAELQGQAHHGPSDLLGLNIAFEAALATLWMAYQPIVRGGDGSVFAYEALMRTESKTLPHPGAMLSAAESLGRLDDLGRHIRKIAPGPFGNGNGGGDALLFLNLHPRDLADPLLLETGTALGAIADQVVMEITERASLDKIPGALDAIRQLRERGFRIAVDDLGSGYAGLTSFAMLEPDVVKIDMALVRDVDKNTTKQKLVHSVVELSRDMGISVVAEGIETPAERDRCVELGVDLLQGYLIGRPGPAFPRVNW